MEREGAYASKHSAARSKRLMASDPRGPFTETWNSSMEQFIGFKGGDIMPKKEVIAVVGATGAQGGGLARAILNDAGSRFAVRALTRDVNSPAARELVKLGAEVVSADVDNRSEEHTSELQSPCKL